MTAREETKKEYQKKRTVKWRRARNKKLQIAETMLKEANDRQKGKDYGAGIAVLGRSKGTEEEKTQGVKKRAKRKTCGACGSTEHTRSTRKICPRHALYVGKIEGVQGPAEAGETIGTSILEFVI